MSKKELAGLLTMIVAALVLILVGVAACTHTAPKPAPTPIVSCVGDHDNDCPANEPDNDGH